MRDYWIEIGPPAHISILMIARAFGIEVAARGSGSGGPPQGAPRPGPSIAELAAMIPPPVAGGDTGSASIAAIKIMSQKGGGDVSE